MTKIAVFEDFKIRRYYDEKTDTWYFSVVNIIQVLTQQADYQTARKYWNKLKERLKKEGSESVTNCHQLKLEAADGKKYLTDVCEPSLREWRRMRRLEKQAVALPKRRDLSWNKKPAKR